jgi:hypothetical protein
MRKLMSIIVEVLVMNDRKSAFYNAVLRIFLCAVLVTATAAAVFGSSFDFPDFENAAGQIALNGSAGFFLDSTNYVLRLAPPSSTDTVSKSGSAWYFEPVLVENGFHTSFTFRMSGGDGGADGLAFVIQNDSKGNKAHSGTGGSLGYGANENYNFIYSALAIEFDTYCDGDQTQDLCGSGHFSNHIAINRSFENSPINAFNIANLVVAPDSPAIILNDGNTHLVNLWYMPGRLSVMLDDYLLFRGPVAVDLDSILHSPTAYVGFTAATGGSWQNHDIESWDFQSVPEPASFALLGSGLAMLALAVARRRKRRR